MSTSPTTTLKKLAREAELEVIEYPCGRVLVIGGQAVVHWWPTSRRMTAFVEGSPKGHVRATARNVINLALHGRP